MLRGKILMSHLFSVGVLSVGFVLCRYVFFELHGMKQWPCILFAAGLGVLLVSLLKKGKRMVFFVPLAYLIGFAAGVLFQSEGVDPGGGSTNNLWLIWTAVFSLLTVVGGICELLVGQGKNA